MKAVNEMCVGELAPQR